MTQDKTNEQLGEDPEILKEIATATHDLAEYLKLHDIEVDCCEADWKDTKELIESAHELILKHPNWIMYYFSGDTWGIDSNFVFFTSKVVEDGVIEKIGDYIVNLGAELPEEVVPPRPRCPGCGKEVEGLFGYYPATVDAYANIEGGKLNIQYEEDCKSWDIVDENKATWTCPLCGMELFKAGQEAEMTAFLLCDKDYKEVDNGNKHNQQKAL